MYKIIFLLFYFIPFVYSYNSCVGESHSCYINDNKLYCWGNNDYGQLGIGNNDNKDFPVFIENNVKKVRINLFKLLLFCLKNTNF